MFKAVETTKLGTFNCITHITPNNLFYETDIYLPNAPGSCP